LPCSRPLPLPLEPPDETLTETAPLPDTRPLTPAGPEMTPLLMLMPTLVLGSHEPRVVWIKTLQLPSKEAASAAVVAAATKLAAITAASRVGVDVMFMGTTFGEEFHNLMTIRGPWQIERARTLATFISAWKGDAARHRNVAT
jgi:hypothetical protein